MQVTMEVTQILLVMVVITLTVILTFVGIQVFFILKEVRQAVRKLNKVLDDAATVSQSIAEPISSLSNFLTGLKSGSELVRFLLKEAPTRKEEEENG